MYILQVYNINFRKLYALDSSLYSRSVGESVRWQTQFPSESVDKVRALFPSLEPTKNRTNIQCFVIISSNKVVHTEIKFNTTWPTQEPLNFLDGRVSQLNDIYVCRQHVFTAKKLYYLPITYVSHISFYDIAVNFFVLYVK